MTRPNPNDGTAPSSPDELFGLLQGSAPDDSGRARAASPGESAHTPVPRQCSRKGCRNGADWALLWNNPRIHTPERRKVWLACADHRDWLQEYLTSRGLWKQTVGVDAIPGDAG